MSRIRLAVVVNEFPSTSETFIRNKVRGLIDAGIDVTVITEGPSAVFRRVVDVGASRPVPVESALLAAPLGMAPWRVLRRGLRSPAAIATGAQQWLGDGSGGRDDRIRRSAAATQLAGNRFDIIHFEFSGLGVRHLPNLRALRGVRLATSCRGTAEVIKARVDPARRASLTQLFGSLDLVHCVSQDMADRMIRIGAPEDRILINRPSIDAGLFNAPPADLTTAPPLRLLSTGRATEQKGYEFALLAMRELVRRGFAFHYDIIGGGPLLDLLRFTVAELGLEPWVTLHGSQPPSVVRERLEACHVFVLPSLWEGLSNAVLEAMACGRAVVSTNVNGMPEAITDGVHGRLVPSRDPGALADAVVDVAADPVRYAAMCRAARARIEADFTIQRQIAEFVSAYERLMTAPPRGLAPA